MIELSVVVITKNQEWNVARLLESILEATSSVESREIILVDSASTDTTTEIASHYPVHVVRLHSNQHLCAAAGRYVGYHQTTDQFVLFVAGDMELCVGWFENALMVMKSNSDVAVVTGIQKSATRVLTPTTAARGAHLFGSRRMCDGRSVYDHCAAPGTDRAHGAIGGSISSRKARSGLLQRDDLDG